MENITRILRRSLPHLLALFVFAAVSMTLFYPQYQDKALRQGDVVNHEGAGKDIVEHEAEYGEHPHWTGRMFGGMPAYSLSLDHGFRLYDYQWWLHFLGMPSSMIFLAMAGFYLMLLMFGVNPYLAIVGGLAYGLSTYFPIIIGAGHITKMWALQWVAPTVGSIYYAYNNNRWTGSALAALFTAMLVGSSHIQITYYFLFVIAAIIIAQFIFAYKDKMLKAFAKTSALLLLAGALGIGSNFAGLYYLSDYAGDSTRGSKPAAQVEAAAVSNDNTTSGLDRDYITAWSYGKAETFNLFIPNFVGGGRNFEKGGEVDQILTSTYQAPSDYYKYVASYYGEQPFTEGPVYIGAVVIFLAIFGMFLLPGRKKWWIISALILSILLAWGKHLSWLTDLMIDYFPMYNKFRVPSMILVIAEWALPLLGVLGVWRLWRIQSGEIHPDPKRMPINKALIWSVGIAGGFALIAAIILPSMINFSAPNEVGADANMEPLYAAAQVERAALLKSDAWRSLLFVLLGAGAVWLFMKQRIKGVVFAAILAVLVVADLFGVDRRYIDPEEFVPAREAMAIQATAADEAILADKSNFRIVDFAAGDPFQSSRASYFHRSVGGYSAAKMARYQELIDAHLSKGNMKAYDMLNTKYFISQEGPQLNASAVGNAVVVDSVIFVSGAAEELAAIGAEEFAPSHIAIMDEASRAALGGADLTSPVDSTDYAELTEYRANRLTYKVDVARERLVVFSEIYHRDWQVTIDGVDATSIEVDYVLRAVVVPAGAHTVVWSFVVPNQSGVKAVAAISSSLILLWLLTSIVFLLINRYGKKAQ